MSLLSRLAVQAARAYGILSSRSNNISADYLVVAGGGGGGSTAGGGGGAGGFLTSTATLSTLNTYTITVGAGGSNAASESVGNTSGGNSVISGTGLTTITATGGGRGSCSGAASNAAETGGSGGGGGMDSTASRTLGAAGTSGQGNAGGNGFQTTSASNGAGGGGGGASAAGANTNGSGTQGGAGGAGTASSISGSSVTYAGGGGGGLRPSGTPASGGSGGGGTGGYASTLPSGGTANTGGGGGGGGLTASGAGGSGVVIISYTSATPKFVGGTITTSGGKQIHTFTSSGTLSPITPITASYLVVAGGGGSARQLGGYAGNGGGGAGGLLSGSTTIYSGATYVVTVGAGGAGGTTSGVAPSGSNSVLSGTGLTTLTSTGGGGGGGSTGTGANGGSGGGGSGELPRTAGTGTSGQGNNGGAGVNAGGGGGGAGAAGSVAVTITGGAGGIGTQSSISGTATYYAGGGGGGAYSSGTAGTGGSGGGGNGGAGASNTGNTPGTANTGGGAGGTAGDPLAATNGQTGGSGIVIISYAGSQVFNGGLVTTSGGNTIHTFTSSGALTPLTNNLNNSLRFRSSASSYLSRTPTLATNRRTWTWSAWVKRGTLNTFQCLLGAGTSGSARTFLVLNAGAASTNDNILLFHYNGATGYGAYTTPVYRDPSAWYHIVVAVDTTQATAANRIKIYVNGNQQAATGFDGGYPAQNTELFVNNNTLHTISKGSDGSTDYIDGYLTDIYLIDGQALEPYYFGNNDANNVWKPIQYKGTYGTNGFYLPFTQNTTSTYAGSFSSAKLTVPASSNFAPGTGNFTVEGFINVTNISTSRVVYSQVASGVNYFLLSISSVSSSLEFYSSGGSITGGIALSPNTWNHFALVRNGSTITLYINGKVSGTLTSSYDYNNTSYVPTIGQYTHSSSEAFLGYISNFRYVKGTAVYTAPFTPPTTALTAITNTQLLTLQDSSIVDNSPNALTITNTSVTTSIQYALNVSVSLDYSGNNNNWTANAISLLAGTTYDAMTDVPTNTSATVANYATLNPNLRQTGTGQAPTSGNLKLTANTTGYSQVCCATIASPSGKFYWEVTVNGGVGTIGIADSNNSAFTSVVCSTSATTSDPNEYTWGWSVNLGSGNKKHNNVSTSYGSAASSGDVYMCAVDIDNSKVWWGKNGTWFASGSPTAGTNAAYTNVSGNIIPYLSPTDGSGYTNDINFGQRPFSYTPPTGFVALNTYNLPTPTILQGNKYMDATLYTQNGAASNVVVNAGQFKPDLVWLKCRSNAGTWNNLVDSVRGGSKTVFSNSTSAELTDNFINTFNSNGFTLNIGDSGTNNTAGRTQVAWQWQAGQGSTSSNTSGSITSTVSVNTTDGFSVVTYAGTLTSAGVATVGHGLGVAPKMIISKSLGTSQWVVQHTSLTSPSYFLYLNTTDAQDNKAGNGTMSAPTSTVFSTNWTTGLNTSGSNFVAYCWAEIAGFSKFGKYSGNGSADGPFVYLGFRPKYVMIKNITTSGYGGWVILDTSRNTYNVTNLGLAAESSGAEFTVAYGDLLSNGIKFKIVDNGVNASGQEYIYMAFAENPFKNANAR